jgi:LytR cell envelope-related transcriptional attenuator
MPRAMAAVLVGLVIAVVVVALVLVTSSSSSSTRSASGHNATSGARQVTSAAVLSPSSVTVALLNGTATSGLASRVSQRLVGAGYKKGMVGNAADETHTSTVVAYTPGNERGALAIAKSLGLSNASVQPVDQATLQIACPPPSSCTANVVVTIGADLASNA